jgi:uncharacterized repeat protein (TIGR01451 family)
MLIQFMKNLAKIFMRSLLFRVLGGNKRRQHLARLIKTSFNFISKYKYFLIGLITFSLVLLSQISFFPMPATAATIAINKSFSPGSVNPGQPSTLTVQFFNSNAFQLTNTSVTDNLPTGMTVASPANITNSCLGAVTAGTNSFSLAGGTVPQKVLSVDGTCSFSVDVVTTVQGNTINTIPANAVTNNQLETNLTPASATLSVTAVSSPSLSKSFAPNTINATGNSTLSVNILNNAIISLTNVDLTDNLPPNVTVNGLATKNTSCGGGAVSSTATSVSVIGVSIAAGATCTFTVPVTSTVIGAYTNTVLASSITNSQGVTNIGNSTANLNVQNPISLTKGFATTPIVAGQSSNLNINIVNNGSVNLTNVNLTDNLPTNVVAVAGTATKNANCQGGSVSNTIADVSLTGVTVTAGTTCTFTVPVTSTVLNANGAARTYTNTIPINSLTNTQGYTNTSAVTANLVVNNPLTITKVFSPTPVLLNGASTLTINFTNSAANPTNITGATITDSFPAGLQTTGAATKNANCVGGSVSNTATTVTLTGVAIVPGTTCTVIVPVTPTTTGNKTNSLTQNTLTTTQGYTNPTVNSTLGVNASVSAPTVTKSFLTTPINLGATSVMRLDIVNTSAASSLTNVALTDIFGAGLIVATPSGLNQNQNGNCTYPTGGVTATAGSNQLTVSGLTIPPSSTCRIQVNVTATSAGTYTNTIPINAITNDQGVTNAAASSPTLGVQALRAIKAFAPTSVSVGQVSTLTVTLQNYQIATQMTGVAFTDNLPTNLTIANPPTPTTTCGVGTITATAGTNLFGLSGGTINGATNATTPGTCTISVKVVPSTTGNKANSIPIGDATATGGFSNLAPANATLAVTNDVVNVTKSFAPSPVNVGVPSTLTINLSVPNANSSSATDVAVVDTLPTNVVIAPTPNLIFNGNCLNTVGTARSITTSTGTTTSTINISGVEITKNTTCTITVNVVGNINGVYTNNIPAGAVTTTEGFSNPTAASAPLTVIGIPISKAFFPSTIASGGRSTLTVTINNLHTFPLTGVNLTDNLPAGVTIASPPSASTTCGTGSATATAGASSFALSAGTVPAKVGAIDGVCTFQVNVTSALSSGSRINNIPVNQMTSNEGLSNLVAASATLNFTSLNINVNKAFSPLTVSGGSASQLTVTLSNPSLGETYYNVSFTDTLPVGMSIASPANPVTTCTNGVVNAVANGTSFSFSGGQIAPNGSCTVSVNATSLTSGNLTNTIPIGGVTTFQGATNIDPTSATLTTLPGVGVGKSFSPNLIEPNETSLLTITIINADTLALTNMAFTDVMPAGVIIATPANASTTCGGTVSSTNTPNPQVSLSGGALSATSTCRILVNVTSTTSGSYLNEIPINSITTTQGVTNPRAVSDTLQVAFRPTIAKSFSPTQILPGGTSTATLQLSNTNTVAINLTSNLIDNLPSGLVVANSPSISGTCTIANVTAPPATATVTYSSGSTIPVGGCTINFNVTGSSSGNFINAIASGALQTNKGNNVNPATAALNIAGSPELLLVKRITAINNIAITGFNDDVTTNDNNTKWPGSPNSSQYLRGAVDCTAATPCNGGTVAPGGLIEYTIYFLSDGATPARNFQLCDRIPANTVFQPDTYGSGNGILLGWNTTGGALPLPDPTNSTIGAGKVALNNVPDADAGQFLAANVSVTNAPTPCDSGATNPDGAILVRLGTATNVPEATGSGLPTNSYGFVRFVVSVR